jgi:hypothetical protein
VADQLAGEFTLLVNAKGDTGHDDGYEGHIDHDPETVDDNELHEDPLPGCVLF